MKAVPIGFKDRNLAPDFVESQGKAYTDLADASTGISPQQDNGQRKEKLRGYGTLSAMITIILVMPTSPQ